METNVDAVKVPASETSACGQGRDRGELFTVVYDPRFDRFFLEDEVVHAERSRSLDRQAVAIPWDEWLVPPKASTKVQPRGVEPRGPNPVPELDLSTLRPSSSVSMAPKSSAASWKTRVDNYAAHFERANRQVAEIEAVDTEPDNNHEVKWNGDVLRVRVTGVGPAGDSDSDSNSHEDDDVVLDQPLPQAVAADQSFESTYELETLRRIRPYADGFRGTAVNSACQFVALSESSESSEDEESESESSKEEEVEPRTVLPVFFRGDRVLFRAQSRWHKGSIRRRIPLADFYDVRAANGTLFEAVVASSIQLLQQRRVERPSYRFTLGDKVLWTPEQGATTADDAHARHNRRQQRVETRETYKARVVQLRSLARFDLLLRTGRVAQRVPHEQLRPRDAPAGAPRGWTRRR